MRSLDRRCPASHLVFPGSHPKTINDSIRIKKLNPHRGTSLKYKGFCFLFCLSSASLPTMYPSNTLSPKISEIHSLGGTSHKFTRCFSGLGVTAYDYNASHFLNMKLIALHLTLVSMFIHNKFLILFLFLSTNIY